MIGDIIWWTGTLIVVAAALALIIGPWIGRNGK